MSGVRIFSGACKKQILYGSAFFVLVRAYGKPVSNGVADRCNRKTCQVADQESAVKKDRSTEDGEKNDKISLDASCKKSKILMVWRQGSISVLLPPGSSETGILPDIKEFDKYLNGS